MWINASLTMERFGTALSDSTRQQILLALLDGPSYPKELLSHIEVSQPNLSNHLACLRDCGLVTVEREGRHMRYELASEGVRSVLRSLVAVRLNQS